MINKLLYLFAFLSINSYGFSSNDAKFGLGVGGLFSENICNIKEYTCERTAVSYELFSELDFNPYSIRASFSNFEALVAYNYLSSEVSKITIRSLGIVPYYNISLSQSLYLKLGIGVSMWRDDKYETYFGESIIQSFIIEKSIDGFDFGIAFKIDFYPNYYKSSSDLLVAGIQINTGFSSSSEYVDASHSLAVIDSPASYAEEQTITIYFTDNSSEVTNAQALYEFDDGDYFVVFGYRADSERIITSIERARNIERILKSRYPNSKIDVINMSDHHPLSDSYPNKNIEQERRVKLKVFKLARD
ncbi:hypothetical protein [Vibrio sinaloensis]|uniref:hypothetical protein n=1 Tax=Photobacterium sp. (strain ATCC 43367) TaxID=379097 RepID=UPI0022AF21B7|nr:hypothetical protein [Vibrio sinaloensis]MCZ4294425.1 hypothetical protein [Vibrio sinaloensis]